jgi:cytochrome c oxidase subunit 2
MFNLLNKNKYIINLFLNFIKINLLYYILSKNLINILELLFCDAPESWQHDFQDPASPIYEGVINLHDDVIFCIFFFSGLTFTFFIILFIYFFESKTFFYIKNNNHNFLEFVWTIIPCLFLLFLIFPTFALIYAIDDVIDSAIIVKIIGHQWYWTYELNLVEREQKFIIFKDLNKNFNNNLNKLLSNLLKIYELRFKSINCNFDSYIKLDSNLIKGELRLLEVDKSLYLPVKKHIKLLITSNDVIHSWAIPSLGIKIDACPGRLSSVALYINRPGIFYGQCSEICGIGHAFMPINVHSLVA